MSADEAKINDPDDNEIDITSLYCDTCSKKCYIWSILQNRNIFIGIWDFSQEFKILTFCSGECQIKFQKGKRADPLSNSQ